MTKRNNHAAAQGPLPLREASFEILGLYLDTHLCAPHPPRGLEGTSFLSYDLGVASASFNIHGSPTGGVQSSSPHLTDEKTEAKRDK